MRELTFIKKCNCCGKDVNCEDMARASICILDEDSDLEGDKELKLWFTCNKCKSTLMEPVGGLSNTVKSYLENGIKHGTISDRL